MTNAIDQAMAAANEAANQSNANVPATQQEPQAAPPAPMQGGSPMTMDDFIAGAMAVDGYLKVDREGIHFDSYDDNKYSEVEVVINPNEVQPTYAIKAGNPPTYWKTYDRVTATTGGSWADAVRKAQQADPNAQPYPSADIPMILAQDYGEYEKGTRLGHSLSTTNYNEFAQLWRKVTQQGLQTAPLKVKVSYKKRNKGQYKWATLTFELLGSAEGEDAELAA